MEAGNFWLHGGLRGSHIQLRDVLHSQHLEALRIRISKGGTEILSETYESPFQMHHQNLCNV